MTGVLGQESGLPAAWAARSAQLDRSPWRLLDLRCGTVLHFLRLWRLWQQSPLYPGVLHVVAALPQPPSAASWTQWVPPEFQSLAAALAPHWWGLNPGLHRLSLDHGQFLLTLWIGTPEEMVGEIAFQPDTVLVDDSTPAALLQAVPSPSQVASTALPLQATHAVVIGGGIAGAAAAAALARRGWQLQVIDAAPEPAQGASGLPAGLLAPHLSPDDTLLSRLSRHGLRATLDQAMDLLQEGADWQGGGALEHRLRSAMPHLPTQGFAADWSRKADPEACAQARLPEGAEAIWHGRAGWIRPAALVRAWLDHPQIRWRGSVRVQQLRPHEGGWQVIDSLGQCVAQAPLVVIAAALGSAALSPQALQLQAVRGQISWGRHEGTGLGPAFAINGEGHLLPRVPTANGLTWVSGSSYGRGETDTDLRALDHQANLARLIKLVPAIAQQLAPAFEKGQVQGWAGVRCASADRRPLVGELAPGLWVSTAMGSRGLTFSALCAQLLAAKLHGEPLPLPQALAGALDVNRQAGRARGAAKTGAKPHPA